MLDHHIQDQTQFTADGFFKRIFKLAFQQYGQIKLNFGIDNAIKTSGIGGTCDGRPERRTVEVETCAIHETFLLSKRGSNHRGHHNPSDSNEIHLINPSGSI